MKVAIFSEVGTGGNADYAHDQARALADRGIEVEMLCSPEFPQNRAFNYPTVTDLREPRPTAAVGSPLRRKAALGAAILGNSVVFDRYLRERRPDHVLLHFSEYLAPLWAWRLRRLRRQGMHFHSVLHDPVRHHRVGPPWWHDWSVREAYSFLDTAFVHTRQPVPVPSAVKTVWVPYGVHSYPPPTKTRAAVRAELGVPEQARLMTSYGYVRDNKNLDLVLRAMAPFEDLYLLVAGNEIGAGNKPVSWYRALAEELGCADRCRWITRYISAEETGDLLAASDLAVLTYARSFVSSSASLGVVAQYRLPCLISTGSETTKELVEEYRFGVWAEPDDLDSLRAALVKWLAEGVEPRWAEYTRDISWERNAEIVETTFHAAEDKS